MRPDPMSGMDDSSGQYGPGRTGPARPTDPPPEPAPIGFSPGRTSFTTGQILLNSGQTRPAFDPVEAFEWAGGPVEAAPPPPPLGTLAMSRIGASASPAAAAAPVSGRDSDRRSLAVTRMDAAGASGQSPSGQSLPQAAVGAPTEGQSGETPLHWAAQNSSAMGSKRSMPPRDRERASPPPLPGPMPLSDQTLLQQVLPSPLNPKP